MTVSGGLGEAETSGVVVNVIPREGSNTFSGSFNFSGSGDNLQDSNYTQALKDQGLRAPSELIKVYDVSPMGGGRIVRDKLWFYATYRQTGAAPRSVASPWRWPPRWRRSPVLPIGFTMTTPSAIRRRRICSSSIRSPASAWTICSRPIRTRKTGLRLFSRWPRKCLRSRRRRFVLIIPCANRALCLLPVGVAVVPNRPKVPGPDVRRK